MKSDGRYVAGISKVSAVKRTTEVVEHREGGVPHDVDFKQWANKVWNSGSGPGAEVSLRDFRKDLMIDLYNEIGQLALSYRVFRARISEYQALPELDANAVAIQSITLENEGWERDYDMAEPCEISFLEPAV